MVWRKLKGLMLLLAAGVLFSSCINIAIESDFSEDGSATHVYQVTMERAAIEEFGEMGDEFSFESEFEDAEQAAQELGLEVERIDTEDEIGIRLTLNVDDNSNLGQVLNDLFTTGSDGDEPITAFSGAFTNDGNSHTLDLSIDGTSLFGEEMEAEGLSPAMLSSFFTMTYTVRMPGEVNADETTGRILSDGRVQWDLPMSGTESFVASSQSGGGGSSAGTILLVGLLLLLFVGGAAGLALFLYLRGRAKPAPVPMTSYDAPDAPTAPFPPSRPSSEE